MSTATQKHLRDALTLVVGLAVGVVAAVGIGWFRQSDEPDVAFFAPDERVVSIAAPAVGPGAPTPIAAIEAFLGAEMAGTPTDSLDLLARSDRQAIRTITSWNRSRLNRIGVITGFSPIDLTHESGTGTATATTILTLEPSLDPINGLTPPSAATEWRLIEDDGWRVDYAASQISPNYLALVGESDVEPAAVAWLDDGGACDPLGAAGEDAAFRNSIAELTNALCRATTGAVVGPASALTSPAAANGLTDSFGSSIREWARVVSVVEPTPADLVLAPVGDRWVVIDVIAS